MKITLIDSKGNAGYFESGILDGQKFSTRIISKSPLYGAGSTTGAEIDGLEVGADVWRFLDTSVGMEILHAVLNDPRFGRKFLEDFMYVFEDSRDDNAALAMWNEALRKAMDVSADRLRELTEVHPAIPKMPALMVRQDLIDWISDPKVFHYLKRLEEAMPDLLIATNEYVSSSQDQDVSLRLTGCETIGQSRAVYADSLAPK